MPTATCTTEKKTGRIKRVFSDAGEVAHLWAHQTQDEARSSNTFFEGPTFYSYGYHFPVATIVTHGTGKHKKTAVLMTTRTYSNTTSKHIWAAKSASSHMTVFNVPIGGSRSYDSTDVRVDDLDKKDSLLKLFESYQPRVNEAVKSAAAARTRKAEHIRTASNLIAEANEFAAFFGIRRRLKVMEDVEQMLAEAKEAEARALAARRVKSAKHLSEWLEGTRSSVEDYNSLPHAYLRIARDGTEIETTHHAFVPVRHAHRAYKVFMKMRERKETYHRNGHTERLGHYAIDSMDAAGMLKIGCHTIPWSEVEKLAVKLDWANTEPAADPAPLVV